MALDSVLSTPVIPPPPKGASPAAGSSSGSGSNGDSSLTSTSSTSDSGSANAAGNSSGSASGSAAKSSGKGSTASRGAMPDSQAQSASSSGSKAQQGNVTNQPPATAGSGAPGAATQNKNQGPSFIQALAQTRADAQDSATATAAAAPQEVTGSKPKGAKDDHTDTTGTALGFLSQSLAAAMAGLQSTNPGQDLTANTTTDDDSTDAISLAGGGATIQSVVATIARDTAEELKAATTAADSKADPSSSSAAPATDNNAAAVAANAFQAHMASRQSMANADALSNKVNTPVGDTGFADDVGGKITWMANQGVQSASLQLTPEHLGPVEVRISMQEGSASVSFNAAHADTRAALEQALPRLREMFSTQGLTLTDASVSQQSPRGQPQQRQAASAIGAIGGVAGDDSISPVTTSVTRAQLGLVDTYA